MPPHQKKPKTDDRDSTSESEQEITLKYGEGILIKNSTIKKIKVVEGVLNIFGTEFNSSEEWIDFSGVNDLIEVVGLNTSTEKKDLLLKLAIVGAVDSAFSTFSSNPKFIESVFETFEKIEKSGVNHVRLMIVGQTDSGKSTLARILFNHALFSNERCKEERICLFADVDVGQNQLTIPGSMSMVYEFPNQESYTRRDSVIRNNPLSTIKKGFTFNFGDISPKSTIYYDHICKQLYNTYNKIIKDMQEKKSFWIVNTCGWVEGQGYEIIKNAITSCNITHVISFDQNTTRSLEKDTKNVTILSMEKSSHVKKRSTNFRKETRAANFNSYFSNRLNTVVLPQDMVKLCNIDYKTQNTARALTLSDKSLNRIYSISTAESLEEVPNKEVSMFIVMQAFNAEKKTITFLLPGAEKKEQFETLEKPLFVLGGSIIWK